MRSISLSATLTDAFSLNAIFSASSNVMTVLVWELSASCATAFRDIITEAATSRNLGKIFFIILTLNYIFSLVMYNQRRSPVQILHQKRVKNSIIYTRNYLFYP